MVALVSGGTLFLVTVGLGLLGIRGMCSSAAHLERTCSLTPLSQILVFLLLAGYGREKCRNCSESRRPTAHTPPALVNLTICVVTG